MTKEGGGAHLGSCLGYFDVIPSIYGDWLALIVDSLVGLVVCLVLLMSPKPLMAIFMCYWVIGLRR